MVNLLHQNLSVLRLQETDLLFEKNEIKNEAKNCADGCEKPQFC